jgi:hypothetical protein
MSASIMVQAGPAMTWVKSMTLTPLSGPYPVSMVSVP